MKFEILKLDSYTGIILLIIEPELTAYEKMWQNNIAVIATRFHALGLQIIKSLMGGSSDPSCNTQK